MEISDQTLTTCTNTGIFTILIGLIVEKILVKLEKYDNFLTKQKNRNFSHLLIYLGLFGFGIQFLLIYIGFEAYCEKKCSNGSCNYVCSVKINTNN